MKRTVFIVLLVFGLMIPAFAQGWGRGWGQPIIPQSEAVTVSGNLIVSHGLPALRSGDVTYLAGGISRLVGFVDGLKEGAHVTIIGYTISNPQDEMLKILRPTKLTMDGRTYDLAHPWEQFLPEMQRPYGTRGRLYIPQRRGFF